MPPSDFYTWHLSGSWKQLNDALFGGALLVPPTFLVTVIERTVADWNASKRLIRFSRSFVETHPWPTVVEVLKHEMAHQYVSDVLGIEDETAHGPAFQMVCERYGIDGRASGVRRSDREEHAIGKIKKLFSLGASPNENESRAALRKAQGLLDEYGLTEGDLRSSEPDEHGVTHLGEVVLRRSPENYHLMVTHILSRYFRVCCIWVGSLDAEGRSGLQLEIVGRRCDLAIAEHVHDFLHAEGARLWVQTRKAGTRDRLDFFEGIMSGFLENLVAQEKARTAASSGSTAGLVRTAMKANLDDYFDRRNPRRSSIRTSGRQRGALYRDGLSAGRNISLSTPISGAGPKLLGPG